MISVLNIFFNISLMLPNWSSGLVCSLEVGFSTFFQCLLVLLLVFLSTVINKAIRFKVGRTMRRPLEIVLYLLIGVGFIFLPFCHMASDNLDGKVLDSDLDRVIE